MAATSFDDACQRLGIPEAFRKHVLPDAPQRGKLAVARGILPAPGKVLLGLQFLLLGDADPAVAAAADRGLAELPTDRLLPLLGADTHPNLLEFYAYRRPADEALVERIVLLRQANTKTICFLAETGSERVTEMIAANQERLITTPQILRFLERNAAVPRSTVDRVATFLRLYGIEVPEAQAESAPRPTPTEAPVRAERVPVAASPPAATEALPPPPHGELPPDFVPGEVYIPAAPQAWSAPPGLLNPLEALLLDWGIEPQYDWLHPPDDPGRDTVGAPLWSPITDDPAVLDLSAARELGGPAAKPAVSVDLTGLSSLSGSDFAFSLSEDRDEFDAFLTDEREDGDEAKLSIAKMVQKLTVGEKIKLAYKGNKSVRELLVRDSNRIVASAVIKSGRVTDSEVMAIAMNRAISEDVIREVASQKEFLRKYPVKVALAFNPKTPIPVVMSLLNALQVKDLKQLAGNRNVSSAIFTAAGKLAKARSSTRES